MLHCAEVRREEKERLCADRMIRIRIEFSNGPRRLKNHDDEQAGDENKGTKARAAAKIGEVRSTMEDDAGT